MRAIITCSDIEFSVKEVDLGYCTIVESVRQTITMTNKSILAQLYGFCGVPEVSICLGFILCRARGIYQFSTLFCAVTEVSICLVLYLVFKQFNLKISYVFSLMIWGYVQQVSFVLYVVF